MTDISIFDGDGKFIELDSTKLPPAMRDRYEAVRAAYALHIAAEQAEKAAIAEVATAIKASNNTRAYYNSHFLPQTPHDLWVDSFGGGPREAMRRRGLVE
jgi:hypothetical protein